MTKGNDTLYFTYDAEGKPSTVTYNGSTYYYVTNLQGDVLYIVDSDGIDVVRYSYNTWGECSVLGGTVLGTLNPFRYRGYVYDQETELYYLQSRYYNPEWGRFINADVFVATGQGFVGNNMFAYCNNNPVMGYDPTGHFGLVGAIIATGAIVGGLLGAFSAVTTGGNVFESAIEGCLTGALGATCGLFLNPFVAGAIASIGGAVIDIGTQITTQYVTTKTVNVQKINPWRAAKVGLETGIGAMIPAFGDAASNAVDAFGTALIWTETSTIITCTDIAVTNTIRTVQASQKSTPTNHSNIAFCKRERLLM